MSYILDALKRSEQERRQVDASNLSNDMMLIPQKKNKTQWWPFLLLAIFVLNIGAYIFLNVNNDTVIEPNSEENISSLNSKTLPPPHSKNQHELSVSANNYLGQKKIPSHVKPHTQMKKQSSQQASRIRPEEIESEGELIVPQRNARSNDLTAAYIQSSAEQETKKVFIHQDSDKLTVTVGDGFQNESIRSQESINVDPFSSYPNLSELSRHFQKSIPSLIFNSHIYSDDPTARRVMINNVYLREGQRIEGMTLHAIGEFEILLEKNTELFTMPVLRDWQGV